MDSLTARRCRCRHTEHAHDVLTHWPESGLDLYGCRWCACPSYRPVNDE